MDPEDVPPVTDGRALTTDRDRRHLARAGGVSDSEHYQAVSRIRRRIRENMDEDVGLLSDHHPELLEELRAVVCDPAVTDDSLDEAIDLLNDALADLNRARGQREARRALDAREFPDAVGERGEGLNDVLDVENASIENALERIDIARSLIVAEIETDSSRGEPDGDR